MAAGGGPAASGSRAGRAGGKARGSDGRLTASGGWREGFRTRRGACSRLALEVQGRGSCHSRRGTACVTPLALSSSIMPSTFCSGAEPAGGHGPLGHTPANTS